MTDDRMKQFLTDAAIREQIMSVTDHAFVTHYMDVGDHDKVVWWQEYRARYYLWMLLDG